MSAKSLTLPDLLRRHARATPERVFMMEVGGRSCSYAELDDRIARWSGALQSLGVAQSDTVVTMIPNSIGAVEAWIGLAWLRATEVPINPVYRGKLLEEVLEDSGASVLIVRQDIWQEIAPQVEALASVETVIVTAMAGAAGPAPSLKSANADELLQESEPLRPEAAPARSDIAAILYTSGTTGRSKGVLVPWNQLHSTVSHMFPAGSLDATHVYYSPYPPFHVGGKMPIYLQALAGGQVVLRERFSTADFWPDVRQHSCTTTCLLGSMATFLWTQPPTDDDAHNPLKNVLMIPLITEVEGFKERFDVRVTTLFNMTELSCPIVADGWDLADNRSCGRVREGYEIRLADEWDEPVPTGSPGELLVRAKEPWSLMAGYWRDAEKTVQAWRNQWLHTGDILMCDEAGNYYYVDRSKDAIRRRGENISSFEVERAIMELPGVEECAVIAVTSEWGEDEVMAVVVPGSPDLSSPNLLAGLEDKLPRHMIPRYVDLVSSLPKTETQKIRKDELRAIGVSSSTWDASATSPTRSARGR